MRVLYSWLGEYIKGTLPSPEELADILTFHAFEVESVERIGNGNDATFDIDVLPNRTHDCLSHIGIAKEIATLLNLGVRPLSDEVEVEVELKTADYLTLSVEDSILVPRATKRLIVDVKVGSSPAWLVEKLTALGQRSINNIVDITNFVMLETGQPVHAFDFDKIEGVEDTNNKSQSTNKTQKPKHKKQITIRRARDGEEVTTLDGDTFKLTKDNLVIADGERALDIAGIKGGADSGIDEHTTRVVLSACNFHPTNIRKTSRGLNLLTDASKRFEQGISPEIIDRAVARASQLFAEVAGGRVASDVLDEYPRPRNPYMVGVSTDEVNRLLGTALTDKEIEDIFTRLGFLWKKVTPREVILRLAPEYAGTPYKYGASISYDAPKEFDCSSLVAYLYAHAGISIPRMTVDQMVFGKEIDEKELQPGDVVFARNRSGEGVAEELSFERVADGAHVTQNTLATVSREFLPGTEVVGGVDHNGLYIGDGKVLHTARRNGGGVIDSIKDSQWFSDIVGYRRMADLDIPRYVITVPSERLDIRITADLIEEVGRVYGYENIAPVMPKVRAEWEQNKLFYYTNKIRDILVENGFSEVMTYSFQNEGEVELENPLASDKKYLRKELALLQALVDNERNTPLFGTERVRIFEIGTVFDKKGEHTSLGIGISGKKADSLFADIAEKLSTALGVLVSIKTNNGIAEINLSEIVEKLPEIRSMEDILAIDTKRVLYKSPSPYPFVLRDIALWTPEVVKGTEVEKLIRDEAGKLLIRIDQFDEYKKDGRVSYAYHLVFQSHERTLTDVEINEIMDAVTKILSEKGWEVR